jgi:Tol biopolymer transport system component
MAFVHQRRSFVVALAVALLVGCTASDNAPSTEQTREPREAVSSGLIAFVSDREGSDALFVMQPDGSDVRRLTGELPEVSHPSWSADGQRIAFNAGSAAASDIYLISIDGSGLRRSLVMLAPTSTPPGPRTAPVWRSALIGTVIGTLMS